MAPWMDALICFVAMDNQMMRDHQEISGSTSKANRLSKRGRSGAGEA
jgi:hypothetical protein